MCLQLVLFCLYFLSGSKFSVKKAMFSKLFDLKFSFLTLCTFKTLTLLEYICEKRCNYEEVAKIGF